MTHLDKQARLSRSTITAFVNQHNLVDATSTVLQQSQSETVFSDAPAKPEGPVDLLYAFNGEQKQPAIGFQQVDGESDTEEMFTLTYLDPKLSSDWHTQNTGQ